MDPRSLSLALRRIASAIDNSQNPSRTLVARELTRLVSGLNNYNTYSIGAKPTEYHYRPGKAFMSRLIKNNELERWAKEVKNSLEAIRNNLHHNINSVKHEKKDDPNHWFKNWAKGKIPYENVSKLESEALHYGDTIDEILVLKEYGLDTFDHIQRELEDAGKLASKIIRKKNEGLDLEDMIELYDNVVSNIGRIRPILDTMKDKDQSKSKLDKQFWNEIYDETAECADTWKVFIENRDGPEILTADEVRKAIGLTEWFEDIIEKIKDREEFHDHQDLLEKYRYGISSKNITNIYNSVRHLEEYIWIIFSELVTEPVPGDLYGKRQRRHRRL